MPNRWAVSPKYRCGMGEARIAGRPVLLLCTGCTRRCPRSLPTAILRYAATAGSRDRTPAHSHTPGAVRTGRISRIDQAGVAVAVRFVAPDGEMFAPAGCSAQAVGGFGGAPAAL